MSFIELTIYDTEWDMEFYFHIDTITKKPIDFYVCVDELKSTQDFMMECEYDKKLYEKAGEWALIDSNNWDRERSKNPLFIHAKGESFIKSQWKRIQQYMTEQDINDLAKI